MKKKNKTNKTVPSFSLTEVIIIIIITTIIVSFGSGILIYRNYEKNNINKTANSKYVKEFEKTFNKLTDNYVEKVDKDKLLDAAIDGMFTSLNDPYSSLLDEEEMNVLNDKLEKSYDGIGIEITDGESGIEVTRVFIGPAKNVGVKKGDIITKVNGINLTGKTSSYLSSYIQGNSNKKVRLEVKRNGKTKIFDIIKTTIDYPTVYSEKYDKVGYLYLTSFANKSAEQFNNELNELEKSGIKGLIIDLRGNTGGYLNSAYKIADIFLEKGKAVYQLKEKKKTVKYKAISKDKKDYKVVILIDKTSASASEVLTLALKDSYNAKVVGETSYGKGSVQQTSKLKDGSVAKYTTSKWLGPNGESIDNVGIKPDYAVKYEQKDNEEYDSQLKKALELLK